jgi:hypothetical protein
LQIGVRFVDLADSHDFARQREGHHDNTRIRPSQAVAAIDPLLDSDFVYDGKTPKQL